MEVVDEDDDFDSSIDSEKLSSKVEEVFLIDFKELKYKSINFIETNSNSTCKYFESNEIDLLLKSLYSEKNNLKIFSHYKKGGFRNDN
jgi:hypothetical protein